jgi:hypothetical protein
MATCGEEVGVREGDDGVPKVNNLDEARRDASGIPARSIRNFKIVVAKEWMEWFCVRHALAVGDWAFDRYEETSQKLTDKEKAMLEDLLRNTF